MIQFEYAQTYVNFFWPWHACNDVGVGSTHIHIFILISSLFLIYSCLDDKLVKSGYSYYYQTFTEWFLKVLVIQDEEYQASILFMNFSKID